MATASTKSFFKVNYKKEFYRIKKLVNADNVIVSIYNKPFFKNGEAAAYSYVWDRKISIAGKAGYKFLIMRLLHEYGHVVDYDRWKFSKRWKTNINYLQTGDYIQIVPLPVKQAILYSEFLADELAKRLIRKFKSSYPEELINEHQFINIHLRNFELTYGKNAPPCIVDLFLKNMHQGITKDTFMHFHF